MTRDEARQYINDQLPRELTKAKKKIQGRASYICPMCGNGSGKNGTGLTTKDEKHWSCWKGCFTSLDYLDILKRQHHTTNERDIFDRYGLDVEGRSSQQQPATGAADTRNFILQAQKDLQHSQDAAKYLRSRGISVDTAAAAGVGYDSAWKSPTALAAGKNPPASRRLIFPTSGGGGGYTARSIDTDTPPSLRYMKEGAAGIFNLEALRGDRPVYITEGAINALSIMEVDGASCAIGSTSSVDTFLALLDQQPPAAPLILSLDNDEAGRAACEKLGAGLGARGIRFTEINIASDHNDANEALVADRNGFLERVNSDSAAAASQEAEEEKAAYCATAAAYHLHSFQGEVAARAARPIVSTGFTELDIALDGGLHEGLYIFGALSSLGKTTFTLQMADQVAASGTDVLIFSLEMSRHELMAKSLSRLTFQYCGGRLENAKTIRGLLDGTRHARYGAEEKALINSSYDLYGQYAHRVYIHEGMGDIGVFQIRAEVAKHIAFTGNAPVVMVDYLQILAPHEPRATDKQNTDKAVTELKRLSRDYKTPVFAISSFNRENYTAPVNMTSFKESGAIEYSSDVLLGLQLDGMDVLSPAISKRSVTLRKIDALKAANPRRCQLKILKNRNGRTGANIYFEYYPKFNTFEETLTVENLDLNELVEDNQGSNELVEYIRS